MMIKSRDKKPGTGREKIMTQGEKREEVNKVNRERMDEAVDKVIDSLCKGELPPWSIARFGISGNAIPCMNYSMINRVIIASHETIDARGFKAWKKIGRHVNKGAKAIWIWAPIFVNAFITVKDDEGNPVTGENGQEIKKKISRLCGFRTVAVFKVEDTSGKDVAYDLPKVPAIPLVDIAEAMGVTVTASFPKTGGAGWYNPVNEIINVCSEEAEVFYHELIHHCHKLIKEEAGQKMISGQNEEQEIVAELGAACLSNMMGQSWNPDNIAKYIQIYNGNKSRVIHLFTIVEKCIAKIVDKAMEMDEVAA